MAPSSDIKQHLKRLSYPILMVILYRCYEYVVILYRKNSFGITNVSIVNFFATLILLASYVFILKHFQKELFHHWRVTKQQVMIALLLFVCAQLLRLPIKSLINYGGTSSFQKELSFLSFVPLAQALLILNYNIIGPILEELICRAGFMDAYFKNSRHYLDVLLSASFFSAFHFIGYSWSWIAFIFYLIPSLALSMAYRYSKNIYIPIVMHIAWNSLADLWALIS
ncbi:lysostaphin resistance A-like protein [Streptococcus sp. E24BD]|uniref:CPBP family intramembrane glutamic endopeptidase n=1 Tax=Streptococcus sp. E24BD TaxID=3278715 RepID=UPI00359E97A6